MKRMERLTRLLFQRGFEPCICSHEFLDKEEWPLGKSGRQSRSCTLTVNEERKLQSTPHHIVITLRLVERNEKSKWWQVAIEYKPKKDDGALLASPWTHVPKLFVLKSGQLEHRHCIEQRELNAGPLGAGVVYSSLVGFIEHFKPHASEIEDAA